MSAYTDEDRAEAEKRRIDRGWAVLAQMQRILELHTEGLRRSVISERLGVTRITTWRRMRVLGLVDGRRK